MKPITAGGLAVLLLIAAAGAVHAQRGWSNPYPQYPQSPPGGGYLTDAAGTAQPETQPARRCPAGQARRSDC